MTAPRGPVASGLRLAVGTMTILPVGDIGDIDRRSARAAMLLTPLAVAPVAAVAVGLGRVTAWWGVPSVAAGACVVASVAYGSRAMHLDGLADTVDGLGGGWTRERALEIMRRGDVGPMGVGAIVLVLLVQATVLGALVASWQGTLLAFLAIAASRCASAVAASHPFPAARPEGMGALVAGSVPLGAAAGSAAALTVLMALAAVGCGRWGAAPASVVGGAGAALALVAHASRRLGGVTGDVIGASVEVFLTVELLVLAGVIA